MFGRDGKPRVVHLKSRTHAGAIVLTWDARRERALRWRVLRSERGPADGPFADTVVGSGQSLVSDKTTPGSHDELDGSRGARHYAIFAEDERGQWHRVAVTRVVVRRGARRAEDDFESGPGRTGRLDAGWAARADSGDDPGHR